MLQLTHVHLKHFRCFTEKKIDFEHPLVLIEGNNGSGKTTLLEAIHYMCYLRSFKTYSPKELVQFGSESFFAKASFINDDSYNSHEIQVGLSGNKRVVKLDQKPVSSYKELMSHYRIVTLTEDDLQLVKGAPDIRRTFIDQVILLDNPDFIQKIKSFRQVLDHRNKLLQDRHFDAASYAIWTEQLWTKSREIQELRLSWLERIEKKIKSLVVDYFDGAFEVSLTYTPKKSALEGTYSHFEQDLPHISEMERRFGRSVFGAHLDDFQIKLENVQSKHFSSRGQQKAIALLLKISQIEELLAHQEGVIFLLDDFMTDFDARRAELFLNLLTRVKGQLIFTSPVSDGYFVQKVHSEGAQRISLTV